MENYFFIFTSSSSSKPYRNQHSSHLFQSLPSFISIFVPSLTSLAPCL